MPRVAIVLIVVAVIACGGFAALAAIPLMAEKGWNTESSEDWVEYKSEQGRFSIKFPQTPKVEGTERGTPIGARTIYRFTCNNQRPNYEVGYFDLGGSSERYGFDADGAMRGAAEAASARVVSVQRIRFWKREAHRGVLENDKGYRPELMLLRDDQRVYQLLCERADEGVDFNFDVFLKTFKLHIYPGSVKVERVNLPVERPIVAGNPFKLHFGIYGGTPPYSVSIKFAAGDRQLEARGCGDYPLEFKPLEEGVYRCDVVVTDAGEVRADYSGEIKVLANPLAQGRVELGPLGIAPCEMPSEELARIETA